MAGKTRMAAELVESFYPKGACFSRTLRMVRRTSLMLTICSGHRERMDAGCARVYTSLQQRLEGGIPMTQQKPVRFIALVIAGSCASARPAASAGLPKGKLLAAMSPH